VIEAPACWDGKNLDSPNHRDHVGYPGYGTWGTGQLKCPTTHPYVIPSFTLGAWYPVAAGMHFSSDAMVPNAAPGTTFHADYFEGWDPDGESDVDRQLHQQDAQLLGRHPRQRRAARSARRGHKQLSQATNDSVRRIERIIIEKGLGGK
jgi:hypothetical protein